MKEQFKQISFIYKPYKYIKNKFFLREYSKDKKFFLKHCIESGRNTTLNNGYNIMLSIHQLEKGMTADKLRPFGVAKVKKIMDILSRDNNIERLDKYTWNYSLSILDEYVKLYETNSWEDKEEYKIVKDFIKGKKYDKYSCGAHTILYKDFKKDASIDYDKFMNSRHSVRNYLNKGISKDDAEKAVNMAIKSPSACNRQMCKAYLVRNDHEKDIVKHFGQGLSMFELDNANYFIITFDVSANTTAGERNQGWFNAGLFSMNLTNALHSLGIGSCFCQFANSFDDEEKFKMLLKIPENERVAVIIVAGYYAEKSKVPYSVRKTSDNVLVVL